MKRRIVTVTLSSALFLACTADLRELGVGSDGSPYFPYDGGSSGATSPSNSVTTNYRPYCVVTESSVRFSDASLTFKPTSCAIAPRISESDPQVLVFREDPSTLPGDGSTVVTLPLLVLVLPGIGKAPADKTFALTPWPTDTALALSLIGGVGGLSGSIPSGAAICVDPTGAWLPAMGLTSGCRARANNTNTRALLGTSGTTSLVSKTTQDTSLKTKTVESFVQPDGSTLLLSTFEFESAYTDQSSPSLAAGRVNGSIKIQAGTYPTTRDPRCKAEVPVEPTTAACVASFDDCSGMGPDFCGTRCAGQICQAPRCCVPGGRACANDSECCAGLACVNRACVDRPSVECKQVAPTCAGGASASGDAAKDPCGAAGTWRYTCPRQALTSGNCAGLQPFSSIFDVSASIAASGGTWNEDGSGVAIDLSLDTKTCRVTGTLPGVCQGGQVLFDLKSRSGSLPAYCGGRCDTRVDCSLEHRLF